VLSGGRGHDVLKGAGGADHLKGGSGNDVLRGGSGDDSLVGGRGEDTLYGGAGRDDLWGGNANGGAGGERDAFVIRPGGNKDVVHDFETTHDQVDLSAFGLEFSDQQAAMSTSGGATVIDLSGFAGSGAQDQLVLKSVEPDDLDESNFIL